MNLALVWQHRVRHSVHLEKLLFADLKLEVKGLIVNTIPNLVGAAQGYRENKIQLREDVLLEVDIRIVRATRYYPEGIRYRCYLGNPQTREVIVLYDIHPGKPHHRHIRGQEEPYRFSTPEQNNCGMILWRMSKRFCEGHHESKADHSWHQKLGRE